MGLKNNNYEVKAFGVTLSEAYAQLTSVSIDLDGKANCIFEVQQSRSDIGAKRSLETKFFTCEIDKDEPVHKQVYTKAKTELFCGWDDDIVAEELEVEADA